ncbi:MAG: proline--tRNA ligase [Candidatus Paceibacterota bacterium]|jgi:prolyl-tRNA synthetase
MKQSNLFYKTRKEAPNDADSINASYLVRAGFVHKHMAGVYAFLPLGFKVLKKIENIIREEMNKIDGQEILMNVLQPKKLWDETGRWNEMADIFYRLANDKDKQLGLAPTHEEEVTDIVRKNVASYKDLPLALYQIQTKFRNEARAKSGLLRGREFLMKDLYSFSPDEEGLNSYYERVKAAYFKIYERLGLDAKLVEASGGVFSKYSHEFQALIPSGEDEIFYCDKCDFAQNKEIAETKAGDKCPRCQEGIVLTANGTEVGNIFKLMTKFSTTMEACYTDKNGAKKPILMGCYGIGLTRCLASIAETKYDSTNDRMVWPKEIAPFYAHLISLGQNNEAENIYNDLQNKGIETLYDDRDINAGQKFAEADLIGCPLRIIISKKTLAENSVELTDLSTFKTDLIKLSDLSGAIQDE